LGLNVLVASVVYQGNRAERGFGYTAVRDGKFDLDLDLNLVEFGVFGFGLDLALVLSK
jgi:hypothetical protein